MNALGLFGGTFDPIHYGHIRPILDVCRQTGINEVRYIPSARPGHRRTPRAPAQHRLNMVALALADIPQFVADDCEIRRAGKSYMVPTLRQFRSQFQFRPLCLILGMDAFSQIHRWHWWAEVLRLANIIVVSRFGETSMVGSVANHGLKLNDDPHIVQRNVCGSICRIDAAPVDVSSTRLRKKIAQGDKVDGLIPAAVASYVAKHKLYR